MITMKEIDNMRFEGEQATENLAKIARALDYRNGGLEQLQLKNGCFVTDLTHMLEENSGLCEVMVEWIQENLIREPAEMDRLRNEIGEQGDDEDSEPVDEDDR